MWYKQILASFYTIIYSQVKQKKKKAAIHRLLCDRTLSHILTLHRIAASLTVRSRTGWRILSVLRLYALLVKAVDIPEEALEHELVLIM